MAAAKKTTKKSTTKTAKKVKRKAPARKAAAQAIEDMESAADHAGDSVESIFKRIQANFKEAGEALSETGAIASDKRHEVLLAILENAQENADSTFAVLREVMEADSFADSLRIQREALREGIERNVSQVRDVASLTAEGSRESIEPVAEFFSTLRDKVRDNAAA